MKFIEADRIRKLMRVPSLTNSGKLKLKDTKIEVTMDTKSMKYLSFMKVRVVFSAMIRQKLSMGNVMAS